MYRTSGSVAVKEEKKKILQIRFIFIRRRILRAGDAKTNKSPYLATKTSIVCHANPVRIIYSRITA